MVAVFGAFWRGAVQIVHACMERVRKISDSFSIDNAPMAGCACISSVPIHDI